MDAVKKADLHPVFKEGPDLRVVELSEIEYMRLLTRLNAFDAEVWPPGKRDGARLLQRIREIEQNCAKAHGNWDWELLSEELQDEYDVACSDLDELIEPDSGERYSLEEVAREVGIELNEL